MLLLNAFSAAMAVASSVAALKVPRLSNSGRVYEKLNGPPAGWAIDDSTPIDKETSTMKLRVQLVPQNMDIFHELAMNVRFLAYLLEHLLMHSLADCHSWARILRKAPPPACH
jgi:tripeptidyl-peptidase-1